MWNWGEDTEGIPGGKDKRQLLGVEKKKWLDTRGGRLVLNLWGRKKLHEGSELDKQISKGGRRDDFRKKVFYIQET